MSQETSIFSNINSLDADPIKTRFNNCIENHNAQPVGTTTFNAVWECPVCDVKYHKGMGEIKLLD